MQGGLLAVLMGAVLPAMPALGPGDELGRQLARRQVQVQAAATEQAARLEALATAAAALAQAEVAAAAARAAWQRRLIALLHPPGGAQLQLMQHGPGGDRRRANARFLRLVALHDQRLQQAWQRTAARLGVQAALLRQRQAEQAEDLQRQRQARSALLAQHAVHQFGLPSPPAAPGPTTAPAPRLPVAAAPGRSGSFQMQRGRLPWPTQGTLRGRFGHVSERIYHTEVRHAGWELAAPAGTPVRAVAVGSVVQAGWLRGYGQVVILAHADGFHSIYAHLASQRVVLGQSVPAQAVLGQVGDTGSWVGPGLYFELRAGGRAVDPQAWLRPR